MPRFEPRNGDPMTFAGVVPVVSREDTPPDVTAAVIEWVRQSDDCSWWTFSAANDWFQDRDVGVVCLRPGGHVMAVLAATDTD